MKSKKTSSADMVVKSKNSKRKNQVLDDGALVDLNMKDMLLKDEKILLQGHIHWGIYWKSAVLTGFGLLVLIFMIFEIGAILTIAGLIGLAYSILMKHMLMLVLTNKRILFRYGILQVDVVDMHLKNIESVELERMLPGFILGYSNVVISGIGSRVVVIPFVANGIRFRRKFNELLVQRDEKNNDPKIVVVEKGDANVHVETSADESVDGDIESTNENSERRVLNKENKES